MACAWMASVIIQNIKTIQNGGAEIFYRDYLDRGPVNIDPPAYVDGFRAVQTSTMLNTPFEQNFELMNSSEINAEKVNEDSNTAYLILQKLSDQWQSMA